MANVKFEYPLIDENGNERKNLIKHYAEDENGKKYYILQVETGVEYAEAIDIYPCRYSYQATDKEIEKSEGVNL